MAKELIFDKTENEKPVRVGTNNPLPVTSQFSDSASIDAFGRLRVANPVILALVAWSNDAGVTASFTFNWEEVR